MTFRFQGLVPAFALLAMGVAHAQPSGGGGQMAYPDPLPSGKVTIPAPTARDVGNMAYPASPGGVTQSSPTGRDVGNMAYPTTGGSAITTHPGSTARTRPMAAATPAPAVPAAPPTAAGMAAARALDTAPGSAPVPYTDFATPAKPMMGHHGAMMHKKGMHPVAMKKKAAPAATPAAPAK